MDNELLFYVDKHQMHQDAHEGNVPSFNDLTLQIRKSSCIPNLLLK
jgi:hypothetical protein